MKIKHLLAIAVIMTSLCSCGSSNKTASDSANDSAKADAAVTPMVMQTDPIVIELEDFEGRSFGGERCYIVLYDKRIKAMIPTVVGMVRSGMASSAYALSFNQTPATISEPRADKKGRSYAFNVVAKEGHFFGARTRSNWRFSITISKDGRANIYVDSDEISRARGSRTWWFSGYVNQDRTDALKMVKANNPFSDFPEE